MKYIATFYSHYGAIRFKKLCDAKSYSARIMPVPRDLSSSCGTCVQWDGSRILSSEIRTDEVEQMAEITEKGYFAYYMAEN